MYLGEIMSNKLPKSKLIYKDYPAYIDADGEIYPFSYNQPADSIKPKLLLHSCCGPCSTGVIGRLTKMFDITVFYYNPNVYPNEEYIKRQNEQEKYLNKLNANIKLIKCDWDNTTYETAVKGLETCPEGGDRCKVCFYLRLQQTAKYAKENGFDLFATTLSVSPHKNAELINELGLQLQKDFDINYLISDFKKQDGYLNSIRLSKEYDLYRQDYCGCRYSLIKR